MKEGKDAICEGMRGRTNQAFGSRLGSESVCEGACEFKSTGLHYSGRANHIIPVIGFAMCLTHLELGTQDSGRKKLRLFMCSSRLLGRCADIFILTPVISAASHII